MSIINQLASALGRKDEVPNQQLAAKIAGSGNTDAVKELVENLKHKNKDIQSDCIKVLYEVGTLKPVMIADYAENFLELLKSKNNRLQWGAMTALHTVTLQRPEIVAEALPDILKIAGSGSVITRDYAVNILISLAGIEAYANDAFSLLNEQFILSPVNQLPMYAERALPIVNKKNRDLFIKTLSARLNDIEQESKKKRVIKAIEKAAKP